MSLGSAADCKVWSQEGRASVLHMFQVNQSGAGGASPVPVKCPAGRGSHSPSWPTAEPASWSVSEVSSCRAESLAENTAILLFRKVQVNLVLNNIINFPYFSPLLCHRPYFFSCVKIDSAISKSLHPLRSTPSFYFALPSVWQFASTWHFYRQWIFITVIRCWAISYFCVFRKTNLVV